MELLQQFGFNPILLTAQIVNFLIVLFVLRKFLYKPLLDMLQKRRHAIKEGLEQAEEARVRLERVVEEEKQILRKAQTEAVKIIEEAKNQSISIIREAEMTAEKQGEKIIKDARNQIAADVKEAQDELTKHVGKLAVEFLQAGMKHIVTGKTQKDVVENVISQLKTRKTND